MLIAITLLTALLVLVALVIYRWTFTPFGRLTLQSAITARKYRLLLRFIDETATVTPKRREQANKGMIRSQGELVDIYRTMDQSIPGPDSELALRLYWPTAAEQLPVLLFFHGGGFVYGNLDSHENLCRKLANYSNHLVVAVDYRLAPEHPFPAAAQDAYATLLWVADNIGELGGNSGQLSTAGDSAGGNLATVVALMARDQSGPSIRRQILLYPSVDAGPFDQGSYSDFASGFMLTRKTMVHFLRSYAGELEDWTTPYFAPLCCGNLDDLPVALIITAEFDPLRDGAEQYAKKLQEAGIAVNLHRARGVLHGFIMGPGEKPGSEAHTAFLLIAEQLKITRE